MCLASHCNVGHWNGWLPAGKVIYKSRSGKYILSREWQGLALLNRENKFPEKSAKLRALCQFYPYTFACSTIYSTSTDILLVLWSEARSHGVVQYPYRSIFSAAQAESMVDVHSWINPNFANVGESTITSPLEPTLSAQPPLLSWQATLQVSSLPAYSEMCVKGLHNVSGISFGDHRSSISTILLRYLMKPVYQFGTCRTLDTGSLYARAWSILIHTMSENLSSLWICLLSYLQLHFQTYLDNLMLTVVCHFRTKIKDPGAGLHQFVRNDSCVIEHLPKWHVCIRSAYNIRRPNQIPNESWCWSNLF